MRPARTDHTSIPATAKHGEGRPARVTLKRCGAIQSVVEILRPLPDGTECRRLAASPVTKDPEVGPS